ncbi:LysR substrate-binding domain-containing protein [Photobacterium makurazakiensis]|uniref:LysR family transcriptional regulator n=1 Tax=Photobacterium makurazakiensis TaxID=2910234 RepID=UPI003D0A21F1
MRKRHALLPSSFNGMKVFESAARHLSFTLAAEELNVTQSAVSRQIRQLEQHFDFPLFNRLHRALELTPQGKEIAQLLTRQYSELNHTVNQLKAQESSTLRVRVAMSFAVRWLIPRLHSFKARYPELDIVLSSSMSLNSEEVRLEDDDFDIAIYNMLVDPYKRTKDHFIRKEYLAPVYSEHLTEDASKPLTVEELLSYPRLHPTADKADWHVWLKQYGMQPHTNKSTTGNQPEIIFNTLDMALTSCMAGQGVTITDLMLVVHELKQSYLKLPESAIILSTSPWEYYYQTATESDAVTSFVSWLMEEQLEDQSQLLAMAKEHGWQIKD